MAEEPDLDYILTRTHGLHTHLLSPNDYQTLLKSKGVKSVVDYLGKSDYSASLEKLSTENLNALSISRVFYSKLVERSYFLARVSSGSDRNFLEIYLERFLIEDMKRILRAKHGGMMIDASSLIAIPEKFTFHVDFKAMSEASTLQDALDSLKSTKFKEVSQILPVYQKYTLVSLLESFLDKSYYYLISHNLEGVSDESATRYMIAQEVDLVTLRAILDLRGRGVAPEAIRTVIPKPMRLKQEEVHMLTEGNLDSIPEILLRTEYGALAQIIRDALDPGREESLDHLVKLEILRRTRSLMIRNAESVGYIVGYIREAEAEANNLVSIAVSKELGIPEAKIEAMLCVG